jgi:hypothetical protein
MSVQLSAGSGSILFPWHSRVYSFAEQVRDHGRAADPTMPFIARQDRTWSVLG